MSMAATYGGSHAPRFGPENAKLGSTYRNCHKPAVPIIRSVGCHGHKPTNPLSVRSSCATDRIEQYVDCAVLQTKKRKQLEDIKAREELKAARNRLRSILLQKLVNRFKK